MCTKDIQFTMEIWSPGEDSGPLEHTKTSVPGIREFHTVTVNGNSYFPYLDIQLSWNKKYKLNFKVYKKPNKLVKYLNSHSHHHHHHNTAVLSGVELCLALLTSLIPTNINLSMSDIYPDKHEALCIAGQLKHGQKMRSLSEILSNESTLAPSQLEKQSRAINLWDTFFILKYANLGKSHQPIHQLIKLLRNSYNLKWLRPRVVYSRHTNLQECLLDDLKKKLLMGIKDAGYGT